MIIFFRKNFKKIFIIALILFSVARITTAYLQFSDDYKVRTLESLSQDIDKEFQVVIKEVLLIQRRSVYKVKVISPQDKYEYKHTNFLLITNGVCEHCRVGAILQLKSISSIETIDEYTDKVQKSYLSKTKTDLPASTDSIDYNKKVLFLSPAARYKKDHIFHVINVEKDSVVFLKQKDTGFVEILLNIKNLFVLQVQKFIPFPHAELGHGLIISGKSALPKEIQDDFKRSGLMHIVVLSGFNVSVVIQFVFSLFKFGPRLFRFGIGTLFVTIFVIMAGVSSALLRATLMALIALLATLYKKEIDGLELLFVVVLVLSIIDPFSVFYDLSFWLSVAATFGLITMSGVVQDKLKFLTETGGLREAGASSLATQFVVTPLIILINPDISILSFFANILILPLVPLTMALVFVAGVLGFITPFVAVIFGHVSYLLLSYIISITHFVSQLPFATFHLAQNSFSPLFYYIFIIPLCIWLYKKKKL